LISSEKVALIELVKNSFDAEASVVIVRFRGHLTHGEGTATSGTTGTAWTWRRCRPPGLTSPPMFKKKRTRSASDQRRVLCEKGIGRLAAARLAGEKMLTTRRA